MAHPVYLYSPGGSFIQMPDGRPLLMQVGYKGALHPSAAEAAGAARAVAAGTGKANGSGTAHAVPTYEAKA